MRKVLSAVCVLVMAGLMAGCALEPPVSSSSIEDYYKENTAPPPGMARVYVFNPIQKTYISLVDLHGVVFVGTGSVDPVKTSYVSVDKFTVFDVKPGRIALSVSPVWQGHETLSAGQTIFVQPIYRNYGGIFGLAGSIVEHSSESEQDRYKLLDRTTALAKLHSLKLSTLYPEAKGFLVQAIPAQQTPMSLAVPSAAVVGAAH